MNININLNINISYPPRPISPRDSIPDQHNRSKQTTLETQQDLKSLQIEPKTGEDQLSTFNDDAPLVNQEQNKLDAVYSN